MHLLFAHDHRFIPANGAVYSETQFCGDTWSRYLAHFSHLTVAGRWGPVPAHKRLGQLETSSAERVDFAFFANLSSLGGQFIKRPAEKARMQGLVAGADAVVARLPSEIGLLAIACARQSGKPWAAEVVGCPWDAIRNYGSLRGKLYAPVAWWRMRRAVAAAPFAIYVTERFLQARYPSPHAATDSASNVELPARDEDVLGRRLCRIDAPPSAPLRLGLIGTLQGRFKGIQTIVKALAQARCELPQVTLHVLGGGDAAPWRALAAQSGVGDIVHFEGTLPAGGPVLDWLDRIDLYLQPSLQEGLPRALIEAMSRGCPAIASSIAGIPELLPAEDMIVPGRVRQLSDLLRRRAKDRNWMRDRALRNWERACDYEVAVLETRRARFWSRVAEAAAQQAGQ